MELKSFEQLMKSEGTAKRFLLGFCWKNHQRHCPACRARRGKRLADKRRRCLRCGLRYHDFTGRWIGTCRLTLRQWLRLVKVFEFDPPAAVAAAQAGIAYNTARKALAALRLALAAGGPETEKVLGLFSPASGKGTRLPLFTGHGAVLGLQLGAGAVLIEPVPGLQVESVYYLGLETVRRFGLAYTEPWRGYDALVFAAPAYLDTSSPITRPRGLRLDREPFWRRASAMLARRNGLPPCALPLHLAEAVFRHNHRHAPWFSEAVRRLCTPMPESAQALL